MLIVYCLAVWSAKIIWADIKSYYIQQQHNDNQKTYGLM